MIHFVTGNLLEARAEALVNPVNCVGVMGAGVALQFKKRFKNNFLAYKQACDFNYVQPGEVFVFDNRLYGRPDFIINFPTKIHWLSASKIEWIQDGLTDLRGVIIEEDIRSIAIPKLGCGLGCLSWKEVLPTIANTLGDLYLVDILIYGERT